MDSSQIIRDAVARVTELRNQQAADPALARSVQAIKTLQSRRFAGTYSDLLAGGTFQNAANFFLRELYCDKDFSDRDNQFSRIAGALQTFFPQQVIGTAVSLARLHVTTEEFDHAMALQWQTMASPEASARQVSDAARYVAAWRRVGQPELRNSQLQMVCAMGTELSRLTRMPGLRLMLKMMRKPAHLAGLSALQAFLEAGFDTFAEMAGQHNKVETFLSIIREREGRLMKLLFESHIDDSERCLSEALKHSEHPITRP